MGPEWEKFPLQVETFRAAGTPDPVTYGTWLWPLLPTPGTQWSLPEGKAPQTEWYWIVFT